jgi:hypothetical protein
LSRKNTDAISSAKRNRTPSGPFSEKHPNDSAINIEGA